MRSADLVASGSSDGLLRFWKADTTKRRLDQVASLAVDGFVNGMAFESTGRFLVAAIGQEHRLGRWERLAGAKNGLAVIPLPLDRSNL